MKLFVGAKAFIQHNGKVLMLREAAYDEGSNEGKWDVPGGRIEPEEPILHALRREVMEESGLEVEVVKVLGTGESFQTIKGDDAHVVRIYYLAKLVRGEVRLSQDHDAFEWVDPRDPGDRPFIQDADRMLAIIAAENLDF